MAEKEAARATRAQESYRQLSVAARTLNTASDALSKSVTELDNVIGKLGLGITGWVAFRVDEEEHRPRYDYDEVGYAKNSGKWGLSIRIRSGDCISDAPDKIEQWPFNEAPRALRMRAVAKIPDLLDRLIDDAIGATKEITKKTTEVDALTAAMSAIAGVEVKR